MSRQVLTQDPTAAGKSPRHTSRASRFKQQLFRGLYWLLRHVPSWLFSLAVNLLIGFARLLYWLPGNPVRKAAGDVCTLAARAGHRHDPGSVYRQLADQIGMALKGFFAVYCGGVEANLHRAAIDPQSLATIRRCLEEYQGVILTVPHHPGGVFSAFRLNYEVPTFILTRQDPRDEAKSAMHRDMFDHLGVEMLMAKGATPRQVFRTCVEGARQGKAVVFSVDNIHTGRKAFTREIVFGEEVQFGTWAARLARQAGVPILPVYVGQRDAAFLVQAGEPLIVKRPEEGVRHYLAYFEERILADPGSWIHLLDRKWRRVLSAAASRTPGSKLNDVSK